MTLPDVQMNGVARAHQWITLVLLPPILGMLGWIAAQMMEMRDDIHTLKNQTPLQLSSIDQRLRSLEAWKDRIDAGLEARK